MLTKVFMQNFCRNIKLHNGDVKLPEFFLYYEEIRIKYPNVNPALCRVLMK